MRHLFVYPMLTVLLAAAGDPGPAARSADAPAVFARENLVAWCVVPFDARRRTPRQRAEMLERIGIRRLAYDWRDQHLPTFEEELVALKDHGIELTAVWFPETLDANARFLLDTLAKHQ